jgi:hypothetical protein
MTQTPLTVTLRNFNFKCDLGILAKKNEMLEKPLALSSINLVFKDNLVILLCNYKVKRPIYLCEL